MRYDSRFAFLSYPQEILLNIYVNIINNRSNSTEPSTLATVFPPPFYQDRSLKWICSLPCTLSTHVEHRAVSFQSVYSTILVALETNSSILISIKMKERLSKKENRAEQKMDALQGISTRIV